MIYFIYFFFLFWNIISEICGFFPRYFWYLGGPSSRLDSTRFLSSSSSIFILLLLHILSFSSIIPLFFFSFPSFILLLLFFFYHFFFLYFWFLPFHRGLSVLMPLSLSLHGFFFFFFLVFFLLGGFIYLIYGLHSCRREPPRIPKESGKRIAELFHSEWKMSFSLYFVLFCFLNRGSAKESSRNPGYRKIFIYSPFWVNQREVHSPRLFTCLFRRCVECVRCVRHVECVRSEWT